MNTRKFFTHTIVALAAALCPAVFGQEGSAKEEDVSFKFPNKGVRFVICSPTNERLPSPLYAKVKDEYLPVSITSRAPSPRLAPNSEGNIDFYESDPGPRSKETPFLRVPVPADLRNKSICVVQPLPNRGGVGKILFFKEATFPKGSSYIVNLSSSTLELVTSPTGKLEGEETRTKIAPGANKTSIAKDDSNVWGFISPGQNKKLMFSLSALPASGAKSSAPVRIKSSVIMTNTKNTQVSFVVEHPTLKGTFRILSIQYADLEKIKPAPPGKAPGKP